jgi:hypothetical protein
MLLGMKESYMKGESEPILAPSLAAGIARGQSKLAQKDKRSKLDLELFLLALVEREINTPYLLHIRADLSPGATIPVLKRLNAGGYVRRSEPGVRARVQYELTAQGYRHLSSARPGMLQGSIPSDVGPFFVSRRSLCCAEPTGNKP